MNKKRKLAPAAWAAVVAASLMAVSAANADAPDLTRRESVTVVKEAAFYAHPAEATPSGTLGPFQALKVKETFSSSTDIWYKVDTWLGEQWIPQSAGAVIRGEIEPVSFAAHLLESERLYETPVFDASQTQVMTPQEIQVTGRIDGWYRISMADRKQRWLNAPLLLEEIREEPADYDMLLTREEPLYEIPYLQKTATTLAPQTVRVLAKWNTGKEGYRFRAIVWYKIQTDQGPLWILPREEKAGVRTVRESVALPTGGYGSRAPESTDADVWFEPGAVLEASARWGGWYRVNSGAAGAVWINPELSLKRRPLGTAASHDRLYLTGDTAAYKYPSPEAIVHPKGYYAPQEVQSIAKRSADDSLDWYLFRGFDGDLWVPKPRNDGDLSLVGFWSLVQSDPDGGWGRSIPLDVSLTKYSQRHGFDPGEGIPFQLRLQSVSERPLTLAGPLEWSLQIVKLTGTPEEALKRPEQQETVWTRKLPPLGGEFPKGKSVQSIFIEWDQKNAAGAPAAPGEYAARIVPVNGAEADFGEPEVFAILPGETE